MRVACLGFSNIEEFYGSCNFGCFRWIFSNNKQISCTYQNLCMTLRDIFVFSKKMYIIKNVCKTLKG